MAEVLGWQPDMLELLRPQELAAGEKYLRQRAEEV